MSLTPDGGCAKGAIPDQATVSPLRHWRDRGATTANPSPTHDIDLPDEIGHAPPRQHVCPRGGDTVYRVPHRFTDRLLSVFMPVHRYHCGGFGCSWEGNLRAREPSLSTRS